MAFTYNIGDYSRILAIEGIVEKGAKTSRLFSLRYICDRSSTAGDGKTAKTFRLKYNILYTPKAREFSLRYKDNISPVFIENIFKLRYIHERVSEARKIFDMPYKIERGILTSYQYTFPYANSFGFMEPGHMIFIPDTTSTDPRKYAAIYRFDHSKIGLFGQNIFDGNIENEPVGIAAIIENGSKYTAMPLYFGVTNSNKSKILASHNGLGLIKLGPNEMILYIKDVDIAVSLTVKLVRAPAIESLEYIPEIADLPIFQLRSMIQTKQLSGGYPNIGPGITLPVDSSKELKGEVPFPSPIDTLYAISPDGTKIVITNPAGPSDSTLVSRSIIGYDEAGIPQSLYSGSVGLFDYNAETDSITLSANQYQSIIPGSLDYKIVDPGSNDEAIQRQFNHAIAGVCNDGTVIGLFKYQKSEGLVVSEPGVYPPLTPRIQTLDADGELTSEISASTLNVKRTKFLNTYNYVDYSAITSTAVDGTVITTDLANVFGAGIFVHNQSKNMTVLTNTAMYSLGFPWISSGGSIINGVRENGLMQAEVKMIKSNIVQNGTHGSKIDRATLVKLELGQYFHSIFFDILVPRHVSKNPIVGAGRATPQSSIFEFDYIEQSGVCIFGIRSRYYSLPEDPGTFIDVISIPMSDLGNSTQNLGVISSRIVPERIPIGYGARIDISAQGPTSFAALRSKINTEAPIEIAYSNSGLIRTWSVLTDRNTGLGNLVNEYGTVYAASPDTFLTGLTARELDGYEDEQTFQHHLALPPYQTYSAGVTMIQQAMRAGDLKSSQYGNIMIRAVNLYTQWTPGSSVEVPVGN
jgi:hypothetical protein